MRYLLEQVSFPKSFRNDRPDIHDAGTCSLHKQSAASDIILDFLGRLEASVECSGRLLDMTNGVLLSGRMEVLPFMTAGLGELSAILTIDSTHAAQTFDTTLVAAETASCPSRILPWR